MIRWPIPMLEYVRAVKLAVVQCLLKPPKSFLQIFRAVTGECPYLAIDLESSQMNRNPATAKVHETREWNRGCGQVFG